MSLQRAIISSRLLDGRATIVLPNIHQSLTYETFLAARM
jgi:hypothetical protein